MQSFKTFIELLIFPFGVFILLGIYFLLGPAALFCTVGGLIVGHLYGVIENM